MLTSEAIAARRIGETHDTCARIAIVVNTDFFFLSHRATWALALAEAGADVTVIACDTGRSDEIRALGLRFVNVPIGREEMRLSAEIRAARRLAAALRATRPDTVLLVSTRCALLALPWRLSSIRPASIVCVVTGLGRVFTAGTRVVRHLTQLGLRVLSRRRRVSFAFQTRSDLDWFVERRLCRLDQSAIVRGAGVDTHSYSKCRTENQGGRLVVGFASRLFREKGIFEFEELARSLASDNVEFRVAGVPDAGVSSSVTKGQLERWAAGGHMRLDGFQADMAEWLGQVDIFVFPSYHPEGIPRVLLEAGASGCAIVATELAGCRELFARRDAALFVPLGDTHALTKAVELLITDEALRSDLGRRAQEAVRVSYDLDSVLSDVLLLAGASKGAVTVREDRETPVLDLTATDRVDVNAGGR
jgi:glycosyltransferase involved in cell wall biosynthesis